MVKIDRSNNEGQYTAFYEAADELDGLEGVQIRPALFTEADDDVYPSDDNFIPNDFKDVLEQAPPAPSEIALAYLTQHDWRTMEQRGRSSKSVKFLAHSPQPNVLCDSLSPLQKTLIKIIADGREQVIYLIGVAGSGKTCNFTRVCRNGKAW